MKNIVSQKSMMTSANNVCESYTHKRKPIHSIEKHLLWLKQH